MTSTEQVILFDLLQKALIALAKDGAIKNVPQITGNRNWDAVIEGRNVMFEGLSQEWWNATGNCIIKAIS